MLGLQDWGQGLNVLVLHRKLRGELELVPARGRRSDECSEQYAQIGPEAVATHALLKPSSIPPVSELYMALVRLTLRLTRSERGGRLVMGMMDGPASSGKGDDTAADMIALG